MQVTKARPTGEPIEDESARDGALTPRALACESRALNDAQLYDEALLQRLSSLAKSDFARGQELNDEGALVWFGNDRDARHPGGDGTGLYYCARFFGLDILPGSDGFCGPFGGPQCPSCGRKQREKGGGISPHTSVVSASPALTPRMTAAKFGSKDTQSRGFKELNWGSTTPMYMASEAEDSFAGGKPVFEAARSLAFSGYPAGFKDPVASESGTNSMHSGSGSQGPWSDPAAARAAVPHLRMDKVQMETIDASFVPAMEPWEISSAHALPKAMASVGDAGPEPFSDRSHGSHSDYGGPRRPSLSDLRGAPQASGGKSRNKAVPAVASPAAMPRPPVPPTVAPSAVPASREASTDATTFTFRTDGLGAQRTRDLLSVSQAQSDSESAGDQHPDVRMMEALSSRGGPPSPISPRRLQLSPRSREKMNKSQQGEAPVASGGTESSESTNRMSVQSSAAKSDILEVFTSSFSAQPSGTGAAPWMPTGPDLRQVDPETAEATIWTLATEMINALRSQRAGESAAPAAPASNWNIFGSARPTTGMDQEQADYDSHAAGAGRTQYMNQRQYDSEVPQATWSSASKPAAAPARKKANKMAGVNEPPPVGPSSPHERRMRTEAQAAGDAAAAAAAAFAQSRGYALQ